MLLTFSYFTLEITFILLYFILFILFYFQMEGSPAKYLKMKETVF